MLADHVLGDPLLGLRSRREEGEGPSDGLHETHGGDCIVAAVKAPREAGRFAERIVEGRDDAGREERVVIWIERRPGAVWAVGRVVNPQHRETDEARTDDYVWEGYELDDCLEAANGVRSDRIIRLE